MRRLTFALVLCLTIGQPTSAQPADRGAIDQAIASVYQSLVRIAVVTVTYEGGREVKHEAFGSGTIISAEGHVVTNHHVVGRARRIICTLPDKREVPADLVGTDPLSDIAVIKLRSESTGSFPAARFGDSSKLRHGDPVLAMGSPNVGTIVRWIGHDAAIYPGNSGGPLVNLGGEIVGVNEIGVGLSGAIPSNLVRPVVDSLIRHGHVQRSWTGIHLQPRSGTSGSGGLVSWVADGSPAAAAGLRAGDVLVEVNRTPVEVAFAEHLPAANQLLLGLPLRKAARFVVRRDGSDMTLSVTPFERPAAASVPVEVRSWGMVAANLSVFEARDLGRPSTEGVRVMSVRAGRRAAQAQPPLARDDVIVEINGQPIRSVAELEARTDALIKSTNSTGALVAFDRGLDRRLTILEFGSAAPENSPTEASKAWIPVHVQALTPQLATWLGLKGRTGVRVTRVLDEAATLRVGDVILAIDGDPVRASAPIDDDVFAAAVRRYPIGSAVMLSVSRAGAVESITITLGRAPRLPREMDQYVDPDFEFRVRDLTASDREDPRTNNVSGVFVETVTPGGWAALGHLMPKDIIQTVRGHPVATVAELAAQMKSIVAARQAVVFGVRRGVRTMFIETKPAWR